MSAHQRGSTTRRATLVCMCLSSNCNTLSNLIPCRGQSATSQAATLFWSLSCPFLLDSRRPAAPLRTEQVPLSLSQALIHKHHLLLHGVNNFYNFSKTEQSPLQQWNVNVGHHAGQRAVNPEEQLSLDVKVQVKCDKRNEHIPGER